MAKRIVGYNRAVNAVVPTDDPDVTCFPWRFGVTVIPGSRYSKKKRSRSEEIDTGEELEFVYNRPAEYMDIVMINSTLIRIHHSDGLCNVLIFKSDVAQVAGDCYMEKKNVIMRLHIQTPSKKMILMDIICRVTNGRRGFHSFLVTHQDPSRESMGKIFEACKLFKDEKRNYNVVKIQKGKRSSLEDIHEGQYIDTLQGVFMEN